MKFLRGQTLQETIQACHRKRKEGKDDLFDLVELFSAFINTSFAMAYAGGRGIVHRDQNPQNIMVVDFG